MKRKPRDENMKLLERQKYFHYNYTCCTSRENKEWILKACMDFSSYDALRCRVVIPLKACKNVC